MIEQICDNSFLSRQNNLIDVFPVIAGRQLEDVIKAKMGNENFHSNLSYFSWLDFDSEIADIIACALIIAAKERFDIESALLQCLEKNKKRAEGVGDKK